MRVNSAFDGFLANRLLVSTGMATVLLIIFCITPSFKENSDRDSRAKQVNLIIRQIGHRLLLQAGDSTSRVLPVTETREGTFLLRFENNFVFNHDSLMLMSQRLLPKTQFPSGYTVTVHDCTKGDIVYGFQLNNRSPDVLACSGRSQPPGCYSIEFAFADFYKDPQQAKADIGQGSDDLREGNPKPATFKTISSGYSFITLVFIGMLLLSGVLFIRRFRKKPVPVQNQNEEEIIKEPVPELPALGKFLLNVKGQHLILGSEVISLTDKECKLLQLLHKNFGELISRETLMEEIWISEGVITGRSLDMFVSKLRKKLSRDPGLKITNVHGRGYKLEIPESQVV